MNDIAIIGGGLAGLSAGIMARRMGHSVLLCEKKSYPFHKVCGEYISLESRNLLEWLGLPIDEWKLPILDQFRITHHNGTEFRSKLPLGGIGISRFTLDHFLQKTLEKEGGIVLQNTKINSMTQQADFHVLESTHGDYPSIDSRVVLGSFGRNKPTFANENMKNTPIGKRIIEFSPLASKGGKVKDTQNEKHFIEFSPLTSKGGMVKDAQNAKRFIGVKMHVKADIPKNQIELHHFPGGYCGISAIENDGYCLCYLLEEPIAKKSSGNLEEIEERYLFQNPVLKQYLSNFEILTERVSTAGVFFSPRPLQKDGMLFLGDSAGMIPPLAGNGMSMALHSSVIATQLVNSYLKGQIQKDRLIMEYEMQWQSTFSTRLRMARGLQKIMEQPGMTAFSMAAFRTAPFLFRLAASQTHGKNIPIPVF